MHDMPIQLQQEIAYEDAQETLGQVIRGSPKNVPYDITLFLCKEERLY